MNEQEQIEGMAKVIGDTWLVDLEGETKDAREVLDEVDIKAISRELYEQGYRKLPEDSVVLSKEEYERLKNSRNIRVVTKYEEDDYEICIPASDYDEMLKQECKETAKEILQGLEEKKERVKAFYGTDESVGVDIAIRAIKEILKQKGVEVEE